MWDKPYDPPAAHTERSLTIWFGPAHPPRPRLLEFAEELREAVRNASLVGIPRVEFLLAERNSPAVRRLPAA